MYSVIQSMTENNNTVSKSIFSNAKKQKSISQLDRVVSITANKLRDKQIEYYCDYCVQPDYWFTLVTDKAKIKFQLKETE